MKEIGDLLTTVFYRLSCPVADTLGDYHLGRLAPGQRLAAALHLRECPHCAAELALYAAPDSEIATRPRDIQTGLLGQISRVLWAQLRSAAAPALRGQRSAQRLYETNGWRILLEVQGALTGYRRKRLIGRIEPGGDALGVELWDMTGVLDSFLIGPEGYFTFERLKPGAYYLCLRRNGTEVWLDATIAEQDSP